MIAFWAIAALAVTSTPVPNGTKLHPGTACYAIVGGDQTIGATLQTVSAISTPQGPAWDIVVHQKLAGGRFDMRDHFVLRRADLRPIRFDSRRGDPTAASGWRTVRLDYAVDRITGVRRTPAASTPIDIALDHPVWEGNLWGLTFGALPLHAGARFQLPFWQYDKGFGTFTVNVEGRETVDTPGGKVDAWVVQAGDDPAKPTHYLLGVKDGAELGYRADGGEQRLGGDCTGLGA